MKLKLGFLLMVLAETTSENVTSPNYFVDVSFPIHHPTLLSSSASSSSPADVREAAQLFGHRQQFYDDFLQGCYDYVGAEDAHMCDETEEERFENNLIQPRGMVNFTKLGFQKVRAPEEIMSLLRTFWAENRPAMFKPEREKAKTKTGHCAGNSRNATKNSQNCNARADNDDHPNEEDINEANLAEWEEEWTLGETIVNYWNSPTAMVNVEDEELLGGGEDLKNKLWDISQGIISQWTGNLALKPSSLYGIRVYTEGAVLTPHVDRDSLISSAIINIDQDYGEECEGFSDEEKGEECADWPLEVYGHDGKAHNITMQPGDMVLYESHSVIHGRPFPLKANYYANLFIHFEPIMEDPKSRRTGGDRQTRKTEELNEDGSQDEDEEEEEIELPFYILEGSDYAKFWYEKQPWIQEEEEYEDEEYDEYDEAYDEEYDEYDEYDDEDYDEYDDEEYDEYDDQDYESEDYDSYDDEEEQEQDETITEQDHIVSNPYLHIDAENCINGCVGPLSTQNSAFVASVKGDVPSLQALIKHDPTVLTTSDEDGFMCLHLAVAAGRVEAAKLLIEASHNSKKVVNQVTDKHDSSSTPLGWAIHYQGEDHPVVDLLRKFGALEDIQIQ